MIVRSDMNMQEPIPKLPKMTCLRRHAVSRENLCQRAEVNIEAVKALTTPLDGRNDGHPKLKAAR